MTILKVENKNDTKQTNKGGKRNITLIKRFGIEKRKDRKKRITCWAIEEGEG